MILSQKNNILQEGANEISKSSLKSLWFEFKANIKTISTFEPLLKISHGTFDFDSREFPLQQTLERFGSSVESCCC